ncbi:phage late control D protein [Candidatus Hepatincola sp. Av]
MQYKIYINNQENPDLLSRIDTWQIIDNNGLMLDTLSISISNSDYTYEIPATIGATVKILVGLDTLIDMGTFIVNKVESSSEHIYLYCISSLVAKGKDNKSRSFTNMALQDILKTLCIELSLDLKVDNSIANTIIPYLVQNGTTNLQILNDLAELFNALIKIQDNTLIFLAISSLSKEVLIEDGEILSIYNNNLNGFQYSGVKVNNYNRATAENTILAIGEEPYLYLHSNYTEELLNIHMNSTMAQLKARQQLVIKTVGNPNMQAGFKLKLQDNTIYPDYIGDWLLKQVIHSYNGNFTTRLLAERI